MPLVRCPTHDIPYNSENPRGCPACAREKAGGKGQPDVMRELARSSQQIRRPNLGSSARAPIARGPAAQKDVQQVNPSNPWVTTPPKRPDIEDTPLEKLTGGMLKRRLLTGAGALIVVSVMILRATSGTRYIEQKHPPIVEDLTLLRALAVPVNVRMETVFSVLGTQAPRAVPNQPRLQRYSYGTDLEVDAINGRVYAIAIRVAGRVWRGLRVGIGETNAQGALALLGRPRQFGDPVTMQPRDVAGYNVFPSVGQRPRRTIGVEVRPPNGCYDVMVDVQPKLSGILIDGDRRYGVLEDGALTSEWFVTQIRIVSRSMTGPYASGIAC